jgi:nucleotide-binding universal stress UspA family protein
MLPIKTILHPTDFSPSARYALWLASSLARDHGARLVVMHVAGPALAKLYGEVPVFQQLEEHERDLEERLHRLKPLHFKLPVEYRMEKGVPAEEILRVAQETKCDLIVMGTYGRTGLNRMLMGSVAEQVLRKARCPVLAVKSPLREPAPIKQDEAETASPCNL